MSKLDFGIKNYGLGVAAITFVDKELQADKILADVIAEIAELECLVGIPSKNASRKDGNVNNAELLFWHTKGSPVHGYPARPLIEPALEASGNKERIEEDLGVVAELAMKGDAKGAKEFLGIAGQDAVNMIQLWFDDPRNGWQPDAPATIKRKGSEEVLRDTHEMQKAITYVITGAE